MLSTRFPLVLLVVVVFTAWVGAPAGASEQPLPRHEHTHGFENATRWAKIFDNPARDAWQQPDEVIAALELAPDAVVADIGAGTGYFAVRLAAALPDGRIYAADPEPDMVEHLAQRARQMQLPNLIPIKATPTDPQLPELVDAVVMVNVHHHIEDRVPYFRNLAKRLKPSAQVAIIDFRPDAPIGPPRHVRLSSAAVIAELEEAGYELKKRHDFLRHQYFLLFEHAGETHQNGN